LPMAPASIKSICRARNSDDATLFADEERVVSDPT